jgi:FKBP-type peptidyl-prolyl cis-trans isomerase 2
LEDEILSCYFVKGAPVLFLFLPVHQACFREEAMQKLNRTEVMVIKSTNAKFFFMQQVKTGDTVKVHYHGRLTDGTTFDSSSGREPLEFQVGSGQVIKGFDEGVSGMEVGQKKTIQIAVDDAYGQKEESMIVEFPRTNFPPELSPEIGMSLNMTNGSGQVIPVTIVDIKEDSVTLDANHPLAGQDLIFDIELVEINTPSRIIMP